MNPINKRLIIGVTGHRILDNLFEIKKQIISVLDSEILLLINHDSDTTQKKHTPIPFIFSVLTSLAEGADRLVVESILDYNSSANIELVLPLRISNYKKTFKNPEDPQFYALLEKAKSIKILMDNNEEIKFKKKYNPKINNAFKSAGTYIVNHCDVLFVLWNGIKSGGIGGTYDIFKYACAIKKPIILFSTIQPFNIKTMNF